MDLNELRVFTYTRVLLYMQRVVCNHSSMYATQGRQHNIIITSEELLIDPSQAHTRVG